MIQKQKEIGKGKKVTGNEGFKYKLEIITKRIVK